MTILTRDIPALADVFAATPFKVFIPRHLDNETAKAIYDDLVANHSIVLADPFAIPDVSTVFPGVSFDTGPGMSFRVIRANMERLEQHFPEQLADSWIEAWVHDAMQDETEALDVTDLTGR